MKADNVRARLKLMTPDDYGTTIVSYKEQVEGRLAEVNRAKTLEYVISEFAQLDSNLRFYRNIAVWQYSQEASSRFDFLQKARVRIGIHDLKIASTELAAGATLLTRNTRDFARVPGLLFEDWTVA